MMARLDTASRKGGDMGTILYTHAACLEHDPGGAHPECPARLTAVLEALAGDRFDGLDRREAPRASVEQIARVHPLDHVERILAAIPADGYLGLDADTIVSPGSGEAALRAAGALVAAVDAVMARGKSQPGQKTMLDVLAPVRDALAKGDGDLAAVAREAAAATAPMQAVRGRASFLGERSIGHVDPGARSSELIVCAVVDTVEGWS